jgi:hypothetical protein
MYSQSSFEILYGPIYIIIEFESYIHIKIQTYAYIDII